MFWDKRLAFSLKNIQFTAFDLGSLDFYLNSSMKIGFELLREGSKVKQHLYRFQQDDTPGYSKIPLKDYLVVDFCTTEKAKLVQMQEDNHYVRFCIESDYTGGVLHFWKENLQQSRIIVFK
jgi:hypothetical protein